MKPYKGVKITKYKGEDGEPNFIHLEVEPDDEEMWFTDIKRFRDVLRAMKTFNQRNNMGLEKASDDW